MGQGPREQDGDKEDDWVKEAIYVDSPDDMLRPSVINEHFVPIVVTHCVTFVLGVAGNVVIIVTMTRERSARNATSLFLVSLAVADLLLVVVCIPLETVHYFVVTWDQEGTICKLSSYGEMLSAVASVLNLTAVSLERYLVIVYPMKSRSLCTMSNCRRALVAVWVVALVLSVPVTVTRGSQPITYYNNASRLVIYYCWDGSDDDGMSLAVAVYQFCIMFALPCLLIIFCYSRVIYELWISTKAVSAMTRVSGKTFDSRGSTVHGGPFNSTEGGGSSGVPLHHRHSPAAAMGCATTGDDVRHARKQVIKTLVVVIALFLVCWGPRLILQMVIKRGLETYSPAVYTVRVVLAQLPFVHSCLNPLIYSFVSSNFRRLVVRSCTAAHRPCHAAVNACCRSGSANAVTAAARATTAPASTSSSAAGHAAAATSMYEFSSELLGPQHVPAQTHHL